jgi:iron complex transport system ATP-binding protein
MGLEQGIDLRAVDAWLGPRLGFQELDQTLKTGVHTVILGPNGAGKSALIKRLSREIYPVVKANSWLRIFGSSTVNGSWPSCGTWPAAAPPCCW